MSKRVQEFMLDNGLWIRIQSDLFGASVRTDLKDVCPYCSCTGCYADCDGSKGDIDGLESEEDMESRRIYNTMVDGVEALLLSLAGEGHIVPDEILKKALENTFQGIGNNV
jgi:hypothetical protein